MSDLISDNTDRINNTSKAEYNPPCGVLLIDKPSGLTSYAVVSKVKRALKVDKVGHLGTLDPFASGLLPIAVGNATRLTDFFFDGKKQYLFSIKFGVTTDTLDPTGQVTQTENVPDDLELKIIQHLHEYVGEIEQVPPAYSALKMDGRPLYEYMRAVGSLPREIETKKRKIFIEKLELVSCNPSLHEATLRVVCGKGTYIRSLARDIAFSVGTVGHCSALKREGVAPWSLDQSISFLSDEKYEKEQLLDSMFSVSEILPHILRVKLPTWHSKLFASGNILTINYSEAECSPDKTALKELAENVQISAFVSILDSSTLYFSTIEKIDKNMIKIYPKKKML